MNFKKHYFSIIFLVSACISNVYSQDWKADIRELNKTYLEAKSFSMDIIVETYENASDIKPVASYAGQVAKKEESYFTSMIGKITILNRHCILVVDNRQKIIVYKQNNNKNSQPSNFFTITNLDSALFLMTKDVDVKYLVNSTTEKCIQVTDKAMGGSKMEIWITPLKNTLNKIIYYTENTEGNTKVMKKVVVKYNNMKVNNSIPDEVFSEKKYIKKNISGISLTSDFSKYELVNESELTPQ